MQNSSKSALSSDFLWYHSKGNDKPIGSSSANKTKKSNGQNVESGKSSAAYYVLMVIIDLLMIGLDHIQYSG